MHTYFNPYIIYGFNEGSRVSCIDPVFFEDLYSFCMYALDVNKGYLGEACYGIKCKLDINGQISIGDKDKEKVDNIYKKFCEYKKDKKEEYKVKLGYHLVLAGDFEISNDTKIYNI